MPRNVTRSNDIIIGGYILGNPPIWGHKYVCLKNIQSYQHKNENTVRGSFNTFCASLVKNTNYSFPRHFLRIIHLHTRQFNDFEQATLLQETAIYIYARNMYDMINLMITWQPRLYIAWISEMKRLKSHGQQNIRSYCYGKDDFDILPRIFIYYH